MPLGGELRRQLELLGDLRPGATGVDQAQGLVVEVAVEVPLLAEVVDDPLPAPARPVVTGEEDVALGAEQLDRLVEVGGPDVGVADEGAAQGEDVVHRVGCGAARSVPRRVCGWRSRGLRVGP